MVLVSGVTFSQNDLKWRLIPNAPYTSLVRLEDVSFINANSGWVIRSYTINNHDTNYINKTTNGGISWAAITDTSFRGLRSVGFADSLNGWLGTLAWPGTVMFRTTDGGWNWSKIINGSLIDSLGVCGISVVDKNIIYGCGRYFGPARFFKTTNGGENWSITDLSSQITTLIDCHFFNKDSGFVVGGIGSSFDTRSGAILFTSDGGATWVNRVTTPPRGQWCWKISFPDRQHGFASLEKGGTGPVYFLKTTDGGETWEEKIFLNSYLNEEGIGFINASTGWIGGWFDYNYKTTDGGESWNIDPWGYNLNRIRVLSDTLAYAVGKGVYKFSRDSITGITMLGNNIPEKYFLSQNFPNPFNPTTNIKFEIKSSSLVKLTIFDALGQTIETLVNEQLHPGTYQLTFDGGNYTSGVYFYRLVADDFVETKKMLLVK
jgi:photosystem II stability/assembly factor-like uncharacterized protein